ncbi:nucleotidyltransferase family protein [Aciditerrimonas ferrireducens]|uniref:nucleotidyltransferase family protein n=1 Tax=Aciditerrimonas ferrireducens TaxID=667306 RepID=UPI0020045FEF|nr:NTP transferase domain-containing protein [Aciditerrimonas ferrireducens]MCK4176249.1 NTP transferase domain-containing protein [Aciditerrimonas ferrireducens]
MSSAGGSSATRGDRPVLVLLAAGLATRYGGVKPLAPLGLHGEAVVDLTVGDARAAGIDEVVAVLGPRTGPAIAYHLARTWPADLTVHQVLQPVPLGTAHALLCARPVLGERPFVVVNGDDVYGPDALALVVDHLRRGPAEHALVAYDLARSLVGDGPVTRGTVQVAEDGLLAWIDERRQVRRRPDGRFEAADGREPAELDPSTPVSVNLFGCTPAIWPAVAEAVAEVHPQVRPDGSLPADAEPPSPTEVLLPEVLCALVAGKLPGEVQAVRVLRTEARCVGVTHQADLPLAKAAIAELVATGQRPEWPWASPQEA